MTIENSYMVTMKKPFDRIVGPEGEWIDDEGAEKPEVIDDNGLSERETLGKSVF